MTKILAVDDMRSMRDLVKSVLEKRGYEVNTAEDGKGIGGGAENAIRPGDLRYQYAQPRWC